MPPPLAAISGGDHLARSSQLPTPPLRAFVPRHHSDERAGSAARQRGHTRRTLHEQPHDHGGGDDDAEHESGEAEPGARPKHRLRWAQSRALLGPTPLKLVREETPDEGSPRLKGAMAMEILSAEAPRDAHNSHSDPTAHVP